MVTNLARASALHFGKRRGGCTPWLRYCVPIVFPEWASIQYFSAHSRWQWAEPTFERLYNHFLHRSCRNLSSVHLDAAHPACPRSESRLARFTKRRNFGAHLSTVLFQALKNGPVVLFGLWLISSRNTDPHGAAWRGECVPLSHQHFCWLESSHSGLVEIHSKKRPF